MTTKTTQSSNVLAHLTDEDRTNLIITLTERMEDEGSVTVSAFGKAVGMTTDEARAFMASLEDDGVVVNLGRNRYALPEAAPTARAEAESAASADADGEAEKTGWRHMALADRQPAKVDDNDGAVDAAESYGIDWGDDASRRKVTASEAQGLLLALLDGIGACRSYIENVIPPLARHDCVVKAIARSGGRGAETLNVLLEENPKPAAASRGGARGVYRIFTKKNDTRLIVQLSLGDYADELGLAQGTAFSPRVVEVDGVKMIALVKVDA